MEPTPSGASKGDNWMQKVRTGDYVADDYVDQRLMHYDDLFVSWEKSLKFQVGGRDAPKSSPLAPPASPDAAAPVASLAAPSKAKKIGAARVGKSTPGKKK
jgi:hypothetical protein